MATQSFLVTALPRSADPAEQVHVSLFVAHRLTPDGGEGTISDFGDIVDWPSSVSGAQITLTGHTAAGVGVEIPVTADLSMLESATWAEVFPPDLPVRPWVTRDFTSVPWRTFPAHRMQQHALLAHAASMFASPVDPPTMRGNPLTNPALIATGLRDFTRGLRVDELLNPKLGLDDMATSYLDNVTGGGVVGAGPSPAEQSPLGLLALDAHRARLYYRRSEEQHEYREQPDANAAPVPLHRPTPDFHERASMLGDLPPLLRRLGLVIDLRIDDLTKLTGVVDLQADIVIPGFNNAIAVQPRTACIAAGRTLVAASSGGDYLGPILKLGDEERFAVLDLDPDAEGLKLEQYVRNLPRMLAIEDNGDPITSAPHALRATGFSMARVDRAQQLYERLDDAPTRAAQLVAGTSPPLHIEDITRGLRLEVWDDKSGEWHSLHRRRIDVSVEGVGPVLTDTADTGFLQGASLTRADGPQGGVDGVPMNAHEVLAGWDGWSLSAPRPGRVLANVKGEEQILDAPPADPAPETVNPIHTTTRVEPGTLPWLRYGRNYSFRAWAVDLAGNSAPHQVAGQPTVARPAAAAAGGAISEAVLTHIATDRLAAVHPDATSTYRRADSAATTEALRSTLRSMRPPAPSGPQPGGGARGLEVIRGAITGMDAVDRVVLAYMSQRQTASDFGNARTAAPRRAAVESAFDTASSEAGPLMERIDRLLPPDVFSAALAANIADPVAAAAAVDIAGTPAALSDVVTTPRPFLRWSPIVEPAVVPRRRYTEAESLLTLVIRSGVHVSPDGTHTVEIVPPAQYAAATRATYPTLTIDWTVDSQRHLLPPKTTQLEAEQYGKFDEAFGRGDADAVKAALAASLRESGTLFDATVASLTTPGARDAQPNVQLHSSPTAEEPAIADPAITDPAPLTRGEAPKRGQYVAHDVDELIVPYLPDPFATGLTMLFPDAGKDDKLAGLLGVESVTLRYRGDWPAVHPIRLVLTSGLKLHAQVDAAGHTATIALPPGEQLRFRLSSAIENDQLQWLGLWRSLPAALQSSELLREAAADGWFWWLTPATQVRLIHAVPRPIKVPRPTVMIPQRTPTATDVAIVGAVEIHGASTERVDLEASWTECVDDITKPGPTKVTLKAAAAQLPVGIHDDLVVTAGADATVSLADGSSLEVRKVVHQLGDTRHRLIDYRYRATTRYREFFDPRVLPTIEDSSVVGPTRQIDVPSTARPPKPIVRDVLPLFRWYTETEPDQPFALRRTRRAGLRIYLDRPWYASGDGELLGVVLAFGSDARVAGTVSQWGADPVYAQQGPASRNALPLVDLVHLVGLDDRTEPGRPTGPMRISKLVDVAGEPEVAVLPYKPEYDPERRLWFVDVALDPGTAFWPFVRLAVARLQPSSLPGLDLSAVVHCDFIAVPPQRTTTVSRPDEGHVRVVVTGPVGTPGGFGTAGFLEALNASRTMRARLEQRVPEVSTDLGWTTIETLDLSVLGLDGTSVSWSGELPLPTALAPGTPGGAGDLRITVEEWERLPADPAVPGGRLGVEARIVHADHIIVS